MKLYDSTHYNYNVDFKFTLYICKQLHFNKVGTKCTSQFFSTFLYVTETNRQVKKKNSNTLSTL